MSLHRALLLSCLVLTSCDGGGLVPVPDAGTDPTAPLGILVTPESVVVPVGSTVALKATGLSADRTATDLTHVVTWGARDPQIAVVSDALDHEGELQAVGTGSTVIWAESGGVRSPEVQVKVTDAQLLGLSISPPSASLAVGESLQLHATAAFSDGARSDASSQVQWITSNPRLVTVEAGGRLTGRGSGQATVSAEWSGHSAEPTTITVLQGEPDLRVVELRGETAPDAITLTASIANDGTVGVSEVWADVFVDPPSTPSFGAMGDYYGVLDYIDASSTASLTFQFDLEPGPHSLYVLLDTEEQIAELDEQNNGLGASFSIGGGGTALPNLSVAYFDVIADPVSVYYVVDVFNSGAAASGAFYVDAFVDRSTPPPVGASGESYVQVASLPPGGLASADFLLDRACAPCTSWLLIDSYNNVAESNESDNVAGPMTVHGGN